MSSFIDALTQSSATSGSAATQKKDNSVLGKEDFLSLLVAQMKYQDPLNPDDPTEFTAQLAQFSQLEQLFNINDGMENLVSSYQSADRLTALTTIGKEVAFQGDSFSYSGQPATLGYQLDDQAAKVSVAIRKDGVTVAVLDADELGKGTHYLQWDGMTAKGDPAPNGDYSIMIKAEGFQGESLAVRPVVRSLVSGADLDTTSGGILLTSAGDVNFSKILGVFESTTSK